MSAEPTNRDDGTSIERASVHSAQITLESPSAEFIDSYFQAMAEFEREGMPQMPANLTREQFPSYVQRLHDQSIGKNLKEGHVPSIEFWIVDRDGYAGRIILGLAFAPSPDRVGNHVGYAIRPSKRRRGYATAALGLLLDKALESKITRLMPTCAVSNTASRKVIERNGGVLLETMVNGLFQGELRYLISLEAVPPAED